ncbi:MAG: ABC transporter permease [Thermoplasmata archaeon]|nr:MAG: ABC transporter permease [Thermoplasmata archaeon]
MNMKNAIKDGFLIAYKDLLTFFRSPARLAVFVIMPLFMMILTGYIFPSESSLQNTDIAVSNAGGAELDSMILHILKEDIGFKVVNASGVEDIKNLIKEGKVSGGIVIPSDFAYNISHQKQSHVTIITDQTNPQISMLLSSVFNKLIENISTQLAISNVNATVGNQETARNLVEPITIKTEKMVDVDPDNYIEFMAPGLMAMIVMTSSMTGLASAISREREKGTMDGILAAPISRFSIIIGKSISQGVRAFIQAMIVLILAVALFHVKIFGSIGLSLLILVIGIFSFMGIGILISSISKEQETASMIMMTLMFPMMFLSGVFFPIQQMPAFMQTISKFIPLTYMADSLRRVMVLGVGFGSIATNIYIMIAYGIIFTLLAVPLFSKMVNR